MATTEQTTSSPAHARPGKYLTFELAGELCGLEILKVQEIMGLLPVTHMPRTPSFVRGVINLRGRIIPVVDLRAKFDLPPTEDTERSCIVVVQVNRNDGVTVVGLLVDGVSEVLNVQAGELEPAPTFGAGMDTEFLLGLAKVNQKVVMLLDVDRVLASGDVEALETAIEEQPG